ncbi:MAG: ATP-dependent DNA ligase [Acidobacteria bacterium]|nr:MAG: ATP-dependent DNA ligase [Acidobacteriota bacterium]
MLATLREEPFTRKGWLFEAKLDGERCLALRCRADVQLLSRNQKRLNDTYPELVRAFRSQKAERFAVDGEIVTFEGDVTSFSKLQQRMQVRHPPEELRRKIPVWVYAFDLLHLDGYDTRQLPLRNRKELLHKALDFKDPLRFTEHRETDGEAFYREACSKGWEGIIAKNGDSLYVSARSREWLKFKCTKEQEFVIGGYTDPKGQRTGFGALLVGYYEAGKLVYAGKVGTGFDEEILRRLGRQLAQLETRTSPFAAGASLPRGAHWVKPKLVAQIGFAEWTPEGKLRHPRFLGLRSDKGPEEVVREQ